MTGKATSLIFHRSALNQCLKALLSAIIILIVYTAEQTISMVCGKTVPIFIDYIQNTMRCLK
jgi:hypothetical protein